MRPMNASPTQPTINRILLLEDLPGTRDWLHQLVGQVFPESLMIECTTVAEALMMLEKYKVQLALLDLGLPDGSGVEVVARLRELQPEALSVVVTIHDDDEHLFPALQAGAFGYLLKEQPRPQLVEQLQRMTQGEPPLSPRIARRVLAHFTSARTMPQVHADQPRLTKSQLTERENDVLLRVAKGFTLPEIATQLGLSRHTIADYVKQIYRKLNVSSRAEAALEAQRMGLFERLR